MIHELIHATGTVFLTVLIGLLVLFTINKIDDYLRDRNGTPKF